MQNNSNNSGYGWLLFFAIIGLFYYWSQTSNLQKQVTELQAQTKAYNDCITAYKENESLLNLAIADTTTDVDNAKRYLDDLSVYNYGYSYLDTSDVSRAIGSAQSHLDVNTTETNCNIPDAPDVPTPTP
jgi:hypothetical protein